MTTSFAPLTVAIGDLVPHPANVRSNAPETYDPENIAHLKASIAVLGLLQPLLVPIEVFEKTHHILLVQLFCFAAFVPLAQPKRDGHTQKDDDEFQEIIRSVHDHRVFLRHEIYRFGGGSVLYPNLNEGCSLLGRLGQGRN